MATDRSLGAAGAVAAVSPADPLLLDPEPSDVLPVSVELPDELPV
jgi:hypothetical protein